MKKIILGLIVVTLFGCKKEVGELVNTTITSANIEYKKVPLGHYTDKTSYELKVPIAFVNIDSIRTILGIRYKGIFKGTNNLGYVYVDMNNDGLEDIFYPYSAEDNNLVKPDVILNKGTYYVLDNSMLPNDFNGTVLTRKTIVGDFNKDGLPDLFLVNSGFDAEPFMGETCTLLLSDKLNNKYKLGNIKNLPSAFWHGAASGDLNNDGNLDIIALGSKPAKVLYGDGNGNFNIIDWKYNAGYGYITTEIIDVNNDGKHDIILTGDEGRPAPALYSVSTIFWNNGLDFSNQTQICEASSDGWGTVMDIAADDIDGDGIKEILFARTGDLNAIWYGGYKITMYKTSVEYKRYNEINGVNNNSVKTPVIGNWITKMILYKNDNNQFIINADVSGCYAYKDYRGNPFTKIWKQNKTTKIFE
jgi:hypothetical protein